MDPRFGGSFLWGLLTASSLLLAGLFALWVRIGARVVGLTLAFGSGVLISAVAFDLVEEAHDITNGSGGVAAGLFVGCLVFFVGDSLIDRIGGARRTPAMSAPPSNALAIVLGAVLDGIPESMVIGLTLLVSGEIGAAYVIAVFLSNMPEGIAATQGLLDSGWAKAHIAMLWSTVVVVCAFASLAGYTLLRDASPHTVAFVLSFAGGAVLTMLASEMMPEAYEKGARLVGVVTTLGFALAFGIHTLQ